VVRKAIIFITVILVASVVFAASSNKIVKEAKNLIETGDLIAAENLVDSALVESPDDYKLLRTMGNILLQKEEYSQALEYFEKAILHKSKDHESLFGAGKAALEMNESQKALDYFERGLKTKKNKEEFLYGKALALKQLGDLAKADEAIRKAISKDKKNDLYHKVLGDVNFEKQVWSIAIMEYEEALELDSTNTDLYYKLARAQFFSMNFNEAVNYYRKYLKIAPADTTAWQELGIIYEKSNNSSEAIFCYNKLTELIPDDGDNWFKLGDLQYKLRAHEDAGVSLEKAVELGSHVAEAYKHLAKIYQLRKEYFKADSAYTRFEQELGAPDDPEYWFDKGKVMLKIGQKDASFFERAVLAFDKAIELDTANATYWEHSGLALYYKKDYASAIPYFIKRIELNGENVNSLRNLAFCFLKTEKYEQAAAYLEKAIALKPEDAVMRQMIGKIYVFLQKEADAIRHYKIALKDTTGALSTADICKIYGDVGYCYVVLREPQKAIPQLEKAIKCDAKNIDYLYNLASSYHLDNQMELANEYYKKVLDINPNHKGAKEGALRTTTR